MADAAITSTKKPMNVAAMMLPKEVSFAVTRAIACLPIHTLRMPII
jgi:hypothetical protein